VFRKSKFTETKSTTPCTGRSIRPGKRDSIDLETVGRKRSTVQNLLIYPTRRGGVGPSLVERALAAGASGEANGEKDEKSTKRIPRLVAWRAGASGAGSSEVVFGIFRLTFVLFF
jgi:hypothetical protein